LLLGNSADLQLRHTGSNSIIENYAGDLYIRNHVNDQDIIFQSDDGSGGVVEYLKLDGGLTKTVFSKPSVWLDNQAVQLGHAADLSISHDGFDSRIHNGTGKLIIRSVPGDMAFQCDNGSGAPVEYFRLDGGEVGVYFSKNVHLSDSVQLRLGNGNDFAMYHDGSDTNLFNSGGNLNIINGANAKDILLQSDDGSGGLATYLTIDGSREEVVANKPLVQTPGTDDPANNGELVFTVASNTSIKVKYKGSDGAVRSTTLTLS
jgi:hypothetical protein